MSASASDRQALAKIGRRNGGRTRATDYGPYGMREGCPLLHRTCERLEAEAATVERSERPAWLARLNLRSQPGYRDFPWLVRTLLTQKLKIS